MRAPFLGGDNIHPLGSCASLTVVPGDVKEAPVATAAATQSFKVLMDVLQLSFVNTADVLTTLRAMRSEQGHSINGDNSDSKLVIVPLLSCLGKNQGWYPSVSVML